MATAVGDFARHTGDIDAAPRGHRLFTAY